MSPVLSREGYFLTILNGIPTHVLNIGSLEHRMQQMLLELAGVVRTEQVITPELLERLNALFGEYQTVRLRVCISVGSGTEPYPEAGEKRREQRISLQGEFIDPPGDWKRMYMEALISLLEAMEKGPVLLNTCLQCGSWYLAYPRAGSAKFCSASCRNRHHYVRRKEEGRQDDDYSKIG